MEPVANVGTDPSKIFHIVSIKPHRGGSPGFPLLGESQMRRITPREADTLRFICARAPDGSISEVEADRLDEALEPVYFDDADGWRVYFEAGSYN